MVHHIFSRTPQCLRMLSNTVLAEPNSSREHGLSLPTDRKLLMCVERIRLTESCASTEKQNHEFIRSSLSLHEVSLAHHERIRDLKSQTSLVAADTKCLHCSCSCQHRRSLPQTLHQGSQSYCNSFVGISLFEMKVQMYSYILLKV